MVARDSENIPRHAEHVSGHVSIRNGGGQKTLTFRARPAHQHAREQLQVRIVNGLTQVQTSHRRTRYHHRE